MKVRRILATLAATAALFTGALPAAAAPVPAPRAHGSSADGRVTRNVPEFLTQCSTEYFQGDKRLGPLRLPVLGVVGTEVRSYRRTGRLSTKAFLSLYWKPAPGSGGSWIYPPQDGYVLNPDGTPRKNRTTLQPGEDIDRFGSEYGAFLAPEGLPYTDRSIPPASLDGDPAAGCNYHDYRVLKAFTVDSGPIAPWFSQRGLGTQYQLNRALVPGAPAEGFNVGWLVSKGFLQRLI